MDQCPTKEEITAFATSDDPTSEFAEIAPHVTSCPDCIAEIKRTFLAEDAWAARQLELAEIAFEKAEAEGGGVKPDVVPRAEPTTSPSSRKRLAWTAAVAAAIAFAGTVALFMLPDDDLEPGGSKNGGPGDGGQAVVSVTYVGESENMGTEPAAPRTQTVTLKSKRAGLGTIGQVWDKGFFVYPLEGDSFPMQAGSRDYTSIAVVESESDLAFALTQRSARADVHAFLAAHQEAGTLSQIRAELASHMREALVKAGHADAVVEAIPLPKAAQQSQLEPVPRWQDDFGNEARLLAREIGYSDALQGCKT